MPVDYLDATARLIVALALGVVIGLERQVRGSPAGMRTFGLVSVGACLYMMVGLFSNPTPGGAPGDQGRIAAQVVTGIGFLELLSTVVEIDRRPRARKGNRDGVTSL